MNTIQKLEKAGVAHPPQWLTSNVHYEVIMGSYAYQINNELSDVDVYGFCIPRKDQIFTHLAGEVPGFGRQISRFEQYVEHHLQMDYRVYDVTIFNIVKYFQLCMDGNPNMIDSLFVPQKCVLTCSSVAAMVREQRHLFLSKKCYHTHKGYAYAQKNKIQTKNSESRKDLVDKYGYDTKYACHLVRLLNQCKQILVEQDLDLTLNHEQLRDVRNGKWKEEEVYLYFDEQERVLEKLYATSTLRHKPDEPAIKELLLNCLEQHYGSLQDCVERQDKHSQACQEIKNILAKYNI